MLNQSDPSYFLQWVDARELQRRISEFRKINFRDLSYGDVSKAIMKVILFDTPAGRRCVLHISTGRYPAGTMFYRVRKVPRDDYVIPLRTMSKVKDCWEPPAEIVELGRLNKEHEPLLYTSPLDPRVAIGELRIPDGERFSLIVYEATEDVNVTVIGGEVDTDGLGDADALKVEMLQNFLRDEFTRDVGQGTEYLYRISETIAKHYFDMPPEVHDAWCYPSIVDKSKFNVAFRPTTRAKLRLIGVEIAKARDATSQLKVEVVVKEVEGNDDLVYFPIGSPVQREFFPWIKQDEPDP